MTLRRRQFLTTAAGVALASSGCTTALLKPSGVGTAIVDSRTSLDRRRVGEPTAEMQREFDRLLAWMHGAGWTALLRRVSGIDLRPGQPELDALLFQEISALWSEAGFEEFGGRRLVQPGDPAMSLLYHVLASPYVRLAQANGQPAPPDVYATLEQLDALENYIYARARLTESELRGDLTLAVFAYEYRPAEGTPHRRHADLVFARTGVARVGTESLHYNRISRSFLNEPQGIVSGAAVTPARYGLFLAEPVSPWGLERKTVTSRDAQRQFLLPIRKLSPGDAYFPAARLEFLESHRNEKLRRLAMHPEIRPGLPAGVDPEKAPFLRESRSSTETGVEQGTDASLVQIRKAGASALLSALPGPLVREAMQDGQALRFLVPPKRRLLNNEGLANRRYTTLKLLDDDLSRLREAQDFAWSDIVPDVGDWRRTGFRSPRNAPVFVNIRFRTDEQGRFIEHLDRRNPQFEEVVEQGGYWAAMFEDGLCDGCVYARFAGSARPADDAPTRGVQERLRRLPVLPAFSLVAAPDLMPYVHPGDFYDYTDLFLEGGPNSASGGRVRANPNIRRADVPLPAFPLYPHDPLEAAVADTVTAVVSAHAGAERTPVAARRYQTNALPDNASNVFAPGWELTFSRDDGEPRVYFATFGLGSPFQEDMKLCAAANGMWPGSSPDAARTYFGDLEPVHTGLPGPRKPPTAVPLTDQEIGVHPNSPAVREHGQAPRAGWDGEHGPFLEITAQGEGVHGIRVNFADMRGADYVVNALQGKMDFSGLRDLTCEELTDRMDALRRALRRLPGGSQPQFSKFWLVSVERVQDWQQGASGVNIPAILRGTDSGRFTRAQATISGRGMLFVFAEPVGTSVPDEGRAGRRRMGCEAVYICQATPTATAWLRIAGTPLAATPWTIA